MTPVTWFTDSLPTTSLMNELPGSPSCHDAFQFPTTAIRFGNRLAVVNGKFDTGFPPTADQYEVVLVDR